MLKRSLLLLLLVATPLFAVPASVHAVDVLNRDTCAKYEGQAADNTPAICKDKKLNGANPITGPDGILSKLATVLTIVVAIVAVIVIILAGLKIITSGSNPQDVANAREQIIYACVALVIAALAKALVSFVLIKLD
jgi:hypothetical protein